MVKKIETKQSKNALKELEVLCIGNAGIVTDNGYYSEKNLSDLFLAQLGMSSD